MTPGSFEDPDGMPPGSTLRQTAPAPRNTTGGTADEAGTYAEPMAGEAAMTAEADALSCVDMLTQMVERRATDLHLSVGNPPLIRVDKDLSALDFPPLTSAQSRALCYEMMNERQQQKLEDEWEVDFSFGLRKLARFRANVYMQRGSVSGAFRRIPVDILTFEELSLPDTARDQSDRNNGLVLVTGPTGSGKSTTLAAMLDRINSTRSCHIVTIEDPIEYLHHHKKCQVDQREVGSDTQSFLRAIKSVLRQDPDVVLLGEMRDAESIQAALTIAETGHLCLATLHTNSCAQTLARIVDVFPGDLQDRVRSQLSMTLNAVFSQQLLTRLGGGLQLSLEVMICTSAIRAMIRESKIHLINNQIQLGQSYGMQTMNQSLANLVRRGLISEEEAFQATSDNDDLRKSLS